MTKTNIQVWLSFFVKDTVGGTFNWTTLITNVSKNEILREVIVRHDEESKDTKKKIMPYLEAEGCSITSVRGSTRSLSCQLANSNSNSHVFMKFRL